jgi:hypothetical protein
MGGGDRIRRTDAPVGQAARRDCRAVRRCAAQREPGAYSFTVEPIGLPTPQAASVQLAAGTQSYLQVQWVASWQFGYPEVDFSFAPNTFAVLTASPQVAQAYLPTLSYLGQR